ncbi:Polymerase/histidinol phosphatase-like protein [Irpex rosettiformis]|uniref:Polymerase/histidinol phosphatase-like protein n=1 Tax=Irpex rosettiformis TaxID=378272 RepID=A0ACB8U2E0_9APHY|nr:Polymerase/histidinol phosphatase-like protein [Irpex rosettiformis]
MPYSHHSHSGQFCKHAKGTLEEVVQEAIRQGFETYGLTEHVPRYRTQDLYPEEEGMALDDLYKTFNDFLDEAHRLKGIYAGQIKLLVGLETESISSVDLDRLEEVLKIHAGRIEYVVGSVHHVNGIPIDFDKPTYERALASFAASESTPGQSEDDARKTQMTAYLSSYFDAQYELMNRVKPEVIGHVDLCRLYEPALHFIDYPEAYEKLKRNIMFATDYGAVFELNAASLRKGWTDAYPAEDVIAIIKECNGRLALSDDSHGPHAVGLNYGRMADYMRRVGVEQLCVVEESSYRGPSGRLSQIVEVHGNWWEHKFWTSRK